MARNCTYSVSARAPPLPLPPSGCLTNLWTQSRLFLHISSIFGTRCEKGCPSLTWALFADRLADCRNTATRCEGWSRTEGRWTLPQAMGCWGEHCPFCCTVCTKRFSVTVVQVSCTNCKYNNYFVKLTTGSKQGVLLLYCYCSVTVLLLFCYCTVLRGLWMSVAFV